MADFGPAAVSTTTKYQAPNPTNHGGMGKLLLYGGLGVGALLFMHRGSGSTGTSTASTTSATTTATTSSTSPPLGVPGAPVELQQVGGTATSVTVECAGVTGATQYNWYQYGTNLLLGTSPSNVAVIQGLQTNTGYEVYCRAVNVNGQAGPASQALLVTTGAGSPVVYVNNYGGSGSTTSTPTQTTTPTTTSQATLPTNQTLNVIASPATPAVGDATTLTASSTALATYLNQVGSGTTVNWQWIVRSPSGAVVVNQSQSTLAAQSTQALSPNVAGLWAVQVTASVNGKTVGQGTLGVHVIAPTTAAATTPFTPQNLGNAVYTSPSGINVVSAGASPQQRLTTVQQSIQEGKGVSFGDHLQGGAAQAGQIVTTVKHHGQAISGIAKGGAVILNPNATNAEKVSLLATGVSAVYPGLTAAQTAHLQTLAKEGKLKGVTPSGAAIT